MAKTLSFKNALKVATKDATVGISSAIDLLKDMGFNCDYYYKTMANVEDVDDNDLNIKTRDKLYEMLGITTIMQKAYTKVWSN